MEETHATGGGSASIVASELEVEHRQKSRSPTTFTREVQDKVLELEASIAFVSSPYREPLANQLAVVKNFLRAFETSLVSSLRTVAEDGRSHHRTHQAHAKRPAEPAIELDYNRNEELDAMVLQGRAEADAAVIKAGFLGGDGPGIIVLHIFLGLFTIFRGAVGLVWVLNKKHGGSDIDDGYYHDAARNHAPPLSFAVTDRILYFIATLVWANGLMFRAYFLYFKNTKFVYYATVLAPIAERAPAQYQ